LNKLPHDIFNQEKARADQPSGSETQLYPVHHCLALVSSKNILKSMLPEWHRKASNHLNKIPVLQNRDKTMISEE